ncbi:Nuclear pore complex protein Nup98-Nup96 [Homalodisca vitripennis]|nr:Nuclear pore complex protein Nup98-Nup96 [Homalodisca vitripennis]
MAVTALATSRRRESYVSDGACHLKGLNLGAGSSLFGNNANKPNTLFGGTSTGTGLFGSTGFGNTSNTTFGSSTNTGLGMTMPMGSLLGGSTFSTSGTTQQTANPLNQHILALASMPFGDNPLFKNLLPVSMSILTKNLIITWLLYILNLCPYTV